MQGKALFPHVATKNVRMSLNFASPAWSEVEGVEGYLPLQEATEEHKTRATKVCVCARVVLCVCVCVYMYMYDAHVITNEPL